MLHRRCFVGTERVGVIISRAAAAIMPTTAKRITDMMLAMMGFALCFISRCQTSIISSSGSRITDTEARSAPRTPNHSG